MERIAAAAIRLPDGRVFSTTGLHFDAIWEAAMADGLIGEYDEPDAAYGALEAKYGGDECDWRGFVTNEGRFVQREEALRIALQSGQLEAPSDPDDPTWFGAEDIQ